MKVLIGWQAMLRVIFIFKRDNGLKLFLPDGIKISPEFIQELHTNLDHAIEASVNLAHLPDISSIL